MFVLICLELLHDTHVSSYVVILVQMIVLCVTNL